MILGVMLFIDGINISVYLIPAWLIVLAIGYKLSRK
jgi:aromatic amino acid transport protein AroP